MLESLQPWRRGSSGTNSNGVVVRDAFISLLAARVREQDRVSLRRRLRIGHRIGHYHHGYLDDIGVGVWRHHPQDGVWWSEVQPPGTQEATTTRVLPQW